MKFCDTADYKSALRHEMSGLERDKQPFQILTVFAGVFSDDFRRVAQGATLDHDRPVKACLFHFCEHRAEIHFARAELEPDAPLLSIAILGAEAGDVLDNRF